MHSGWWVLSREVICLFNIMLQHCYDITIFLVGFYFLLYPFQYHNAFQKAQMQYRQFSLIWERWTFLLERNKEFRESINLPHMDKFAVHGYICSVDLGTVKSLREEFRTRSLIPYSAKAHVVPYTVPYTS